VFPQNWPSLNHLDPVLQRDLKVGDTIPDGPPGTAEFVVAEVDAPHTLVLHSTTHLPPHWRERFGADLDWTWSFRLIELRGGGTRLQLRVRGRMAPWWLIATYLATIVPADFVMAGGMLRGIKQRAESGAPPKLSAGHHWPGSIDPMNLRADPWRWHASSVPGACRRAEPSQRSS
jgi:hypothetical protein